jgi:hypothetical protein
MQLPPFTWKSALLFLVGVAAVLLIVYMLISALFHMTPRRGIPPPSNGTAAIGVASLCT